MNDFDRGAAWPSLLQLAREVTRRPWLLAAFAVAGGLAGWIAGQVLPSRYEAVALMRMAQIGVKEGKESRLVETAVEAAERVKMIGFVRDAGLVGPGESAAGVLPRIVAKRVGLSEQLIEVRYRDTSAQAAEQGLQKIFDLLRQRQDVLGRPGREGLVQEMRQMEQLRTESQARRDAVMQIVRSAAVGPVKGEFSFLQNAFVGQEFQVAQWQGVVQTALAAPATLPTTLLEPIRADDQPVSPKKPLLVLAGLVAGLLLGALVSLLLAWRRPPT